MLHTGELCNVYLVRMAVYADSSVYGAPLVALCSRLALMFHFRSLT